MQGYAFLVVVGAAVGLWGCEFTNDGGERASDAGTESSNPAPGSPSGTPTSSGSPDTPTPTTPRPSNAPTTPAPPPEPELPSEDCVPDYACDPPVPNTGDPYADCVSRVNQFRLCACMGPLERHFEAEACMDEQAEYDSTRGAHAGFSANLCSPRGNSQNECPAWRSVNQVVEGCIRMMYYEGPPPSQPCEGQCYQAHGHFINMTSSRITRVSCGFHETEDGEVWSVQNFF